MTPVASASPPEPPARSSRLPLVLAAVAAVLVVVGVSFLVRRWVRGGGPRRAITELAEEGAVKLADVLIDEVLPAA